MLGYAHVCKIKTLFKEEDEDEEEPKNKKAKTTNAKGKGAVTKNNKGKK